MSVGSLGYVEDDSFVLQSGGVFCWHHQLIIQLSMNMSMTHNSDHT